MECNIDKVREKLAKMKYGLVGETSAVQVCRWTKNSLKGDKGCWKEKFYGISSSGCVQMTPSVMWCENKCLHCWRPIEMNLGVELPNVDDPVEILDGIIAKRREMLQGLKGAKEVDKETFEEDIEPNIFTMSLSGEATLYPRLGEMFAEIRRRGKISFLVSNGLNPGAIRKLEKVKKKSGIRTARTDTDCEKIKEKKEQDLQDGQDLFESGLPTQLVISCNAPNEELFLKWHRSSVRDAWEKFLESLGVMKSLKGKVRRVIRLTLVKEGEEGEFGGMTNMSEKNVNEYVNLIRRAEPDFVHVKGYKAVGFAKDRMGYDNQVWHGEVFEFTRKLLERLNVSGIGKAHALHGRAQPKGWKGSSQGDGGLVAEDMVFEIGAEDERSCVVALKRVGAQMEIERV